MVGHDEAYQALQHHTVESKRAHINRKRREETPGKNTAETPVYVPDGTVW